MKENNTFLSKTERLQNTKLQWAELSISASIPVITSSDWMSPGLNEYLKGFALLGDWKASGGATFSWRWRVHFLLNSNDLSYLTL